jgi:alcohol dehydrogenase (quinone), cytochrome c subunit
VTAPVRITTAFALLACLSTLVSPAPAAESTAAGTLSPQSAVERGRYLADAGNCFSCHTSAGGKPYAGGVPFETPFGTLYSTNITPDRATGIGSWSAADLRRALHEGIAADGSRLFPAFPYPSYTKVTDADAADIYAYLRTLTPVKTKRPDNSLMFSQRWAMRLWNALFFEPARFVADPKQSPQWNRGAYLVEGLGHCGACHTPRDSFMAEIRERAHQGGVLTERAENGKVRRWSAVNLTGAPNGLAAWSVDDLTRYLHKGVSRRAGTFGPMNEVVVNSTMKLSAEDVRAMAVYLKSLPAGGAYQGEPIAPELVSAGAEIYAERCEDCHAESGRGGMFGGPPLDGSAITQAEDPASLINILLHGPQTPKQVSFGQWETMKPYADVLSDEEIAAVANYVRGSWKNRARAITAEDVARQR